MSPQRGWTWSSVRACGSSCASLNRDGHTIVLTTVSRRSRGLGGRIAMLKAGRVGGIGQHYANLLERPCTTHPLRVRLAAPLLDPALAVMPNEGVGWSSELRTSSMRWEGRPRRRMQLGADSNAIILRRGDEP